MLRRRYLIATGTTLAIAGCSGSDTENVDEGGEAALDGTSTAGGGGQTPAADESASPEQTSAADSTGEPEVVLGERELTIEDDGVTTNAFVEVDVRNEGDAPSGWVTLEVWWYNENGDLLDSRTHRLYTLGPGETWAARVYHLGSDSGNVADFELEGEFEVEAPSPPPDGVELLESELRVGDNSADVVGRVRNGSGNELSYIEAIAKIYDENGVVLGSEYTNETDVPSDTTWQFDVSWLGRDRLERAADHEVVLSDSAL